VQPAKLAAAPVGSGPFRFVRRRGTTIELHVAREVRRGTPWLDAIDLVPYPSVAAAYAAFEAGKVDVAPLTRAESEDADRRGERLVAGPYLAVSFYALSLHDPKLADVRFREAIVRALDARTLVTAGYGATAQVAGGLIPLGVPAGPTNACRARCDHDPTESRRLLATVFPNGKVPPIVIDFDDDPIQRAVAQAMQRDLAAVGIPALPRPHPVADYSAFLALGGGELFRLGWVADYPSSEAFLAPLFSAGAPANVVGLKSEAFAIALRAAEAEQDERRRIGDFARAETAVLSQYVAAPVAQFETRMVIGPLVRGMRLDPFGAFDGAAVWLAPPPTKK
jgi:ABC-type oligopeptide transport system substrate-binding subunit